jgi:hypothetical protein
MTLGRNRNDMSLRDGYRVPERGPTTGTCESQKRDDNPPEYPRRALSFVLLCAGVAFGMGYRVHSRLAQSLHCFVSSLR